MFWKNCEISGWSGFGSSQRSRPTMAVAVVVVIGVACGGNAAGDAKSTGGSEVESTATAGTTATTSVASTTAGGASTSAGVGTLTNATSSATTDGGCTELSFCVDCSTGTSRESICLDDAATCGAGLTLAGDCPEGSCGATLDHCCDTTSGSLVENSCGEDGQRSVCSPGSAPAREDLCVPETLAGTDCWSLAGLGCSGPAKYCRDQSFAEVSCECVDTGNTEGGVWDCTTWFRG